MLANREWAHRNLGFDPIVTHAPLSTYAVKAAAETSDLADLADLQREIIEFDSESRAGREFRAFTTTTGLSAFVDIPWPAGLAPVTAATCAGTVAAKAGRPLPKADVLVVTWTVDEGHALSRVLTPGKDSANDYCHYTHNYAEISKKMVAGCPARELKRLGTYWMTTIGGKSVVVCKSDSHMSQDGPDLPVETLWQQIISEVQPKLVLTTGTAGGIGTRFEVGDVVASPIVRFDCISKFKSEPFAQAHYTSSTLKTKYLSVAQGLFAANSAQLPKDNTRQPGITQVSTSELGSCVVTTDFFGFDTSDNYYKLQGLGDVCEMGDAVLGLVCAGLGAAAPRWLAVRNASDPQIDSTELTLKQQANLAAQIYKGFGIWSSVCSAIVCWALIAAE
jgi:hypothetical protein